MNTNVSKTVVNQYHIISALQLVCFLPSNILNNTNIAEYNTTAGPNGEMNEGEVIRYVVILDEFCLNIVHCTITRNTLPKLSTPSNIRTPEWSIFTRCITYVVRLKQVQNVLLGSKALPRYC